MSNFLSRFGTELGAPGTLARMAALKEQRELDAQLATTQRSERGDVNRILSGLSQPAFARAGGAEPATPEEFRQTQLMQLGGLDSKLATKMLEQLSPQPTERRLAKDAAGFQRFIDTGERAFPKANKDIDKNQLLNERKFKLEQKKFEQDIKEFNQKSKVGGLDSKELFDVTQKLRKEFTGLSGGFIKQRDAFGRIQAVAQQIKEDPSSSGVGDIALIFNFMKVQDPGSTVREGEFATAENSAGLAPKLRNQYNKILRGDRLTPKQRDDFVNTSESIFKRSLEQHDKRVEQFTGVATRAGLDIRDVMLDLGLSSKQQEEAIPTGQSITPKQGQVNEGTVATNSQTGQKLILRGGQWQPL